MYFFRNCNRPFTRAIILLSSILVVLVAACGGEEPTAAPVPTPTPEPVVIRLADAGWETLSINNAIAEWVIENGYDYDVEIVATTDWRKDLTNGTVDVIMEGWQQNYLEWYKKVTADGSVTALGTIYENGPQFFVIPQWVADEYEIRTIYDMEKHWDLFKDPADPDRGLFYNCPTGNQCAEVNPVKLEAYDLYKTYNIADAASYGGLEQTLNAAQVNKTPVFAYYWAPTTVMSQYDWYVLEEPAYSKGCWDQVTAASKDVALRPVDVSCAYPDPGIQILASSSLEEKAPEVADFLRNMRVGLVPLEETTEWFRKNSVQEWEEAAIHYLDTYDDQWRGWMPRENFGKVFVALQDRRRTRN